jgi:hypothetical protein
MMHVDLHGLTVVRPPRDPPGGFADDQIGCAEIVLCRRPFAYAEEFRLSAPWLGVVVNPIVPEWYNIML